MGQKSIPAKSKLSQEHDSFAEAAVVGRALPNNEQEPVAYVVARRPLTSGKLLAHCRTRLTLFRVPREIHIVAELPRNSSRSDDVQWDLNISCSAEN